MSNLKNYGWHDNMFETVIAEDAQGLLENDITDVVIEHGLHADDDREEILIRIAEDRIDALENGYATQ
jgi:hypothetical protein|tara:strand:- start:151 stop:354 length:204 start_codon:yes stop_codon:yes gene_type:complete